MLVLLLALLPCIMCQVNTAATTATKNLWNKIKILGNSDYIAFGQEFPTDFRQSSGLSSDTTQSDCKSVVGKHPAVFGSDFHYYLYKSGSEPSIHAQAVDAAYKRGAIITFDFHMYDRSGTYSKSGSNSGLVSRIVNTNGDDRTWFQGQLNQVISVIKNDLKSIPFVFRPFHEMTGDWFWWGSQNSKADYIALYRFTYNHFKTNGVNNVLWAWSPDKTLDWGFYPGDAYVDIIGIDGYEPGLVSYFTQQNMISVLSEMATYAAAHNKVAVFAETGARDGYSIDSYPDFWTKNVLNPIMADAKARRIAWILTWINAPWGSKPYVPHSGSSTAAKNDFKTFEAHPNTLFESDLAGFFAKPPPSTPIPTTPPTTPTTPPTTPTTPPTTPTTPPTPPSSHCTDVPPAGNSYTCAEQAGWGKCGEAWMQGFCIISCGKCPACPDTPPAGNSYTCAEQAGWGKCGESWMQGFCLKSCGKCSLPANEGTVTEEQDISVLPSDNSGGLSGGAIAGIAIGCVAAVTLAVALVAFLVLRSDGEEVERM